AMGKAVMIDPGETVAIQFKRSGNMLIDPKFIGRFQPDYPARVVHGGKLFANPADAKLPKLNMADLPPDTLVISYGQINAHTPGMILKSEHNFTRPIKFLAVRTLLHMGYFDPYETPTCAVLPGKSRTEIWPDLMGPIMLANIRFIDLPKSPDGSPKVICEK
ncbi:MAG TPA: hypothetical protein VLW75_09230, partial [Rhizomicrobium sp.]|nr:hypothetical protein [Rhizomicrobium sp.]